MRINKKTMYEKPEMDIIGFDADIDTITASNEGDENNNTEFPF